MKSITRFLKQFFWILFFSCIVLQLFFFCRIAMIRFIPIESTTFERTAIIDLFKEDEVAKWRYEWKDYEGISDHLKRAVIASEDSGFSAHYGVEWDAITNAWEYNNRKRSGVVRGGSTITQQLAKNLFLSPEQDYFRKAQELYITFSLELLLSKEQLLELYLNHAEWGKGIYGAQAAAQYYYQLNASQIGMVDASIMAARLPKPRFYQQNKSTVELQRRAKSIRAGMPLVVIP